MKQYSENSRLGNNKRAIKKTAPKLNLTKKTIKRN